VKPQRRRLDWIIPSGTALVLAAAVSMWAMGPIAGISTDLLFWLRQQLVSTAPDPNTSPTAIVAIDEETYRTPPFTDVPHALWTHEIAAVLNALVAADTKVIGFDAIFSTSGERFVHGFDQDFLLALRDAARTNKVVLGEAQLGQFPIHPFQAQIFAIGGQQNIRSVNLVGDTDEIIRRIPLTFDRTDRSGKLHNEPSMALELAARVVGGAPVRRPDGDLALGDYVIPGSGRNGMLVNFAGNEAIPTYSLADLQRCAAGGNTGFFARHFAGKVVLLGGVLDIEDRKLTSMRFITGPDHPSPGERCALWGLRPSPVVPCSRVRASLGCSRRRSPFAAASCCRCLPRCLRPF